MPLRYCENPGCCRIFCSLGEDVGEVVLRPDVVVDEKIHSDLWGAGVLDDDALVGLVELHVRRGWCTGWFCRGPCR